MFTTKIKDHFVTKSYGVIFNHFQLTTHCYNIQLILILSDVHIDVAKVFRWSINTIHFLPCEYNPWCVSWKPFKRVVLSLYNDSVLNKKNFSIFFLWKILPTKIANPKSEFYFHYFLIKSDIIHRLFIFAFNFTQFREFHKKFSVCVYFHVVIKTSIVMMLIFRAGFYASFALEKLRYKKTV